MIGKTLHMVGDGGLAIPTLAEVAARACAQRRVGRRVARGASIDGATPTARRRRCARRRRRDARGRARARRQRRLVRRVGRPRHARAAGRPAPARRRARRGRAPACRCRAARQRRRDLRRRNARSNASPRWSVAAGSSAARRCGTCSPARPPDEPPRTVVAAVGRPGRRAEHAVVPARRRQVDHRRQGLRHARRRPPDAGATSQCFAPYVDEADAALRLWRRPNVRRRVAMDAIRCATPEARRRRRRRRRQRRRRRRARDVHRLGAERRRRRRPARCCSSCAIRSCRAERVAGDAGGRASTSRRGDRGRANRRCRGHAGTTTRRWWPAHLRDLGTSAVASWGRSVGRCRACRSSPAAAILGAATAAARTTSVFSEERRAL